MVSVAGVSSVNFRSNSKCLKSFKMKRNAELRTSELLRTISLSMLPEHKQLGALRLSSLLLAYKQKEKKN